MVNEGAWVSVSPPAAPRDRYRQQVRAEVQELAWEQVAAMGASGLSLAAIAKRMGITPPALYRYFANRDDLLTELILSAYRELASLVEAAAADARSPRARLIALAAAIRAWALEHPHRYLLIYGTPVPGYAAPPEATELARRIFAPVTDAFPDEDLLRPVTFWTRVHGVVSLEVAGHFAGMPIDPRALFDAEVQSMVTGLR